MSDLPTELAPEPLGVPLHPTGHPSVDEALARLTAVDGAPTTEHAAVYEDVHRSLTDALSALDRPEDEP